MRWHLLCLLTMTIAVSISEAADWPGFRGPHGNGVCDEKSIPLKWGPSDNIAWKVKLPGPGASSPVIWGDRVFVTSFTGKKAAEIVRHVQCFERGTGKERWHKQFPAPLPENDHKAQLLQHGFATSTPVTDGQRLYVYFGRGGLHANDRCCGQHAFLSSRARAAPGHPLSRRRVAGRYLPPDL